VVGHYSKLVRANAKQNLYTFQKRQIANDLKGRRAEPSENRAIWESVFQCDLC